MNESHGTPFRRTNCRGCNKPVVFGTNKAIDPDTGGYCESLFLGLHALDCSRMFVPREQPQHERIP